MRRTTILLAVLFTACASVQQPVEVGGVSDRLFCGRSIPGGGEVTDAEVAAFLDEVVTPRFPDGVTIWNAEGRWRGGAERTLVIEVVHPYGIRHDRLMTEIGDEYRRRFRQEAVLRVMQPARMDLLD